ncbi:trypco2 family protein [Streptomyces sp. NPDC004539]|uniref:trypco2 family protein n=1 Tax=Streptomyces sp. NPDC004539 TaxID=3154280 RepID=UPI0033BD02B2
MHLRTMDARTGGGRMEPDGTELSEAIAAVRAGLTAAKTEGTGSDVRFVPDEVVLDLSIELRRSRKAGGGVKAYVLSADASGESAGTRAQRVTVRFRVTDANGDPLPVGDHVGHVPPRRPQGR